MFIFIHAIFQPIKILKILGLKCRRHLPTHLSPIRRLQQLPQCPEKICSYPITSEYRIFVHSNCQFGAKNTFDRSIGEFFRLGRNLLASLFLVNQRQKSLITTDREHYDILGLASTGNRLLGAIFLLRRTPGSGGEEECFRDII
eukprot:853684-Amorphochlora_amoeboformis.AAC.1